MPHGVKAKQYKQMKRQYIKQQKHITLRTNNIKVIIKYSSFLRPVWLRRELCKIFSCLSVCHYNEPYVRELQTLREMLLFTVFHLFAVCTYFHIWERTF